MQPENIDINWVWSKLKPGVGSNKNDYHLMQFGYSGIDDFPKIDTVVMRHAECPNVFFHTDIRSDKITALQKNSNVVLHWYSREDKTQITFKARATIHHGNEMCVNKWANMPKFSRECYHQRGQPGIPYEPHLAQFDLSDAEAFENFSVIECQILSMDILYLQVGANVRFQWAEGDAQITRINA